MAESAGQCLRANTVTVMIRHCKMLLALHVRQVLKRMPYTSKLHGSNSILKCILSFKEKTTTGCQSGVESMDLRAPYKIVMKMN